MTNIISDISTVSTIPENSLIKLIPIANKCISHAIFESLESKQEITELDIGIGTLLIQLFDENIKFKFIPSQKLEDTITSTISTGKSDLTYTVEEALKNKILYAYKNLI